MGWIHIIVVLQILLFLNPGSHVYATRRSPRPQRQLQPGQPAGGSRLPQNPGTIGSGRASSSTENAGSAPPSSSAGNTGSAPASSSAGNAGPSQAPSTLAQRIGAALQPRQLSASPGTAAAGATAGAPAGAPAGSTTGASAGSTSPPGSPLRGPSAAPAYVAFQCVNSSGTVVTYAFHHVIRVGSKAVYMDVGETHTGLRAVMAAPYLRNLSADEESRREHISKVKREMTQGIYREQAFFPLGLSREGLLAKHGFIVAKDYCSLQQAPELLDLDEPPFSAKLLNFFVILPAGHGTLCGMGIATLAPDAVVAISVEIVRRVKALHDLNMIHRKLDCTSIFVSTLPKSPSSRGPEVFLGDFAYAQLNTGVPQLFDAPARLHALDPVLARAAFSPLRDKTQIVVTKQQDAWSCGLLLYSLMCYGNKDPYKIFGAGGSEHALLRRIMLLKEVSPTVDFRTCMPLAAHPSLLWLRALVEGLLSPIETARLLPENAILIYPQLFGGP